AELSFFFDNAENPQLIRTRFNHKDLRKEVIAHASDFQWRAGLKALSIFFARARLAWVQNGSGPDRFTFSDPPAASLYEAFRRWDRVREGLILWPKAVFGEFAQDARLTNLVNVSKPSGRPTAHLQLRILHPRHIHFFVGKDSLDDDPDRLVSLID